MPLRRTSAFHPKQPCRSPTSNTALIRQSEHMQTRLSVCVRKRSYRSEDEALLAAREGELDLRPYRCDRCQRFHLTSRTKGKRRPRAGACSLVGGREQVH